MARGETELALFNRLFEEAVRRHGGDAERIAREVRAQIAAMGAAERLAVNAALDRALAYRAPDFRPGRLN